MSDIVLEVDGLVAGYGTVTVVHHVSLSVPRESIVSIIGPNGAGKSTLLKGVYGLVDVSEGRVLFRPATGDEVELTGLRPDQITAAGINYVPQLANVFPNLTVLENLEMGAVLSRETMDERLEVVHELFPLLDDRRQQRAGTLSGGQRQMVALGRAMMTDPELLILDEPSAGLAPQVIDEVMDLLVEINRRGVSILMVEQNARRSLAMSDLGYVLETGRNRLEGEGSTLLEDPAVVDLYLGG
ncbi:MAG: ATP-binding cassette domain-containing protein [Acidimicrobiia bacterium]|nr:ATP-binding cassette domain-containing protein [Acidimicrobiia bacterium]